jgi:hypothetical protein
MSSSGNPFQRVGIVDPNYLGVTLPSLNQHLFKAAQFSNLNSASRLSGFFINTLTNVHAISEVTAVRSIAKTAVSKATLDSYIDHLKVNGDGILSAINSFRTTRSGGNRAAYAEDLSRSANQYSILANTANYNFAFVHTSARQAVYTVGYHNQQTDFWYGSSKFFWFRAEKHLQFQAATSSTYVTESAENTYKELYERSVFKQTTIGKWVIKDTKDKPASLELKLREYLQLESKELQIKVLETLLAKAKKVEIQATNELSINCQSQLKINGSQIFLSTGSSSSGISSSSNQNQEESKDTPNSIETLPAYQRANFPPNRQQPVTAQGTNLYSQPPI